MTIEEWYALDKKPGMKFRTPSNQIGRLVSVHKDGATLDFTNEDGYGHVVRGFYRCVQLSDPNDPVSVETPKPKVKNSQSGKSLMRKVVRVKTGVVYESIAEAARFFRASPETVRRSALWGITIKKGPCEGERFQFVD